MLRMDFVSNSSSSSFIFDKESWDKVTGGDTYGMDYSIFDFYSMFDGRNYFYTCRIELGPYFIFKYEYKNRSKQLDPFYLVPDKEWARLYAIGECNGFMLPESIRHYGDDYIKLFNKYVNDEIQYDELTDLKHKYQEEVIEKIIKPNIPDMKLICFSGSDDRGSIGGDDGFDSEEERVRSICWDKHSKIKNGKFFRADTAH